MRSSELDRLTLNELEDWLQNLDKGFYTSEASVRQKEQTKQWILKEMERRESLEAVKEVTKHFENLEFDFTGDKPAVRQVKED